MIVPDHGECSIIVKLFQNLFRSRGFQNTKQEFSRKFVEHKMEVQIDGSAHFFWIDFGGLFWASPYFLGKNVKQIVDPKQTVLLLRRMCVRAFINWFERNSRQEMRDGKALESRVETRIS